LADRAEQQRLAIRRGAGHRFDSAAAGGGGLVFHQHAAPEFWLPRGGEEARDYIGIGAGGGGDDEAQRAVLGLGGPAWGSKREGHREQCAARQAGVVVALGHGLVLRPQQCAIASHSHQGG
jgi:hypothetical protein